MGELAALGVLGVLQQRGGGRMGLAQVLCAPGLQAGGAQVFEQLARAQRTIKLPVGPGVQGADEAACLAQCLKLLLEAVGHARAVDQLAGRHAGQPGAQFAQRAFGQKHAALRHAEPRQATAPARRLVHSQQQRFGLVGQQLGIGQCAGGDHAHHLALHRALAHAHLAHLLGNGHRFAHLDQACQVILERMERHPRHHHRLAARLAALRERDVEQARGLFGVLPEQLVKIAHAIEQERFWVPGLEGQVLRNHGCVV